MSEYVAHWDDVEPRRRELGFLGATWRNLGGAAGSVRVGLQRIELGPGEIPTPPHVHHDEEEIVYVLAGSGLSWQASARTWTDERTYAIGAGDVLIHRVSEEPHTLRAGDDGLDGLAFGERARGTSATLPRSETMWAFPSWIELGAGEQPWQREAALGAPDFPPPDSERPDSIRRLGDIETFYGGRARRLTTRALTESTGLNWYRLEQGETGAPRHVHSAEEELFVVLDGTGTLFLGDDEHELRAGHVVSRPAGTGIAHGFRGGPGGLTFLGYGQRKPEDVCFYPTSGRIAFRGLGLIGRIEPAPYPSEPGLF